MIHFFESPRANMVPLQGNFALSPHSLPSKMIISNRSNDSSRHFFRGRALSENREVTIAWDDSFFGLSVDSSQIGSRFQGPVSLADDMLVESIRRIVSGPLSIAPVTVQDLLIGDDQVAIPVSGSPALVLLALKPLIEQLVSVGIPHSCIRVVCMPEDLPEYRSALPSDIQVDPHDSTLTDQKAYLASTRAGTRIYLNRNLLDSDIVIPLIVAEPVGQGPRMGYLSGFWPMFSDDETRSSLKNRFSDNPKNVRKEVSEVLWLSGLHLAIVAVPAARGLASVQAIAPAKVQKMTHKLVRDGWNINLSGDHTNVLLTFESDSPEHLDHIALNKYLDLALRFSKTADKVALVFQFPSSELDQLNRLHPSKLQKLPWIKTLSRIGELTKLFCLSNLPDEIVDHCDIFALEAPSELARLVERNNNWLIVENANRARL